jgi:hypothetical protein
MAKAGGEGRGVKRGVRKGTARKSKAPSLPIGRPPRLAHLVPGTDRHLKRERALQGPTVEAQNAVLPRPETPLPVPQGPPFYGAHSDILCLANPEWLPHILTISGPHAALAAFRRAAVGPGTIPWATDYGRLEEDWTLAMLTPPPSERGISVEGARILAGQLRERIEQQDQRAAEIAFASKDCPLDLHALVPVPGRILRLGPDDPAAMAWLWENWSTTWALRGVEAIQADQGALLPDGHGALRYRFWSADWTPWAALAAIRARWSSISIQVSVRAVSE